MKDISNNKKMDRIFDFVNFNNETGDKDQVLVLAKKYVDFAYPRDEESKKFQDLSHLFVGSEDSDDKLSELLMGLPRHTKMILQGIIGPKKKSISIKLKGVKTIAFKNQEIVENFESDKIQSKKISLFTEKKVLEAAFMAIISNREILLKRFKKCRQCGKYFYHSKMVDCSKRCGNLYRQREHQKKKEK
ncbi:MAG: hypothetical protein K8R73_13905 [Clostridiales bacterium]|nr:hypothetical protein [Clostridiales bacterium]